MAEFILEHGWQDDGREELLGLINRRLFLSHDALKAVFPDAKGVSILRADRNMLRMTQIVSTAR
ncbi:MAG: hypothetical protein CMO80_14945 [Verrucomicrobiales bacterium]|nr:hypothetical protein [Verrucomicrobiales bacterium]